MLLLPVHLPKLKHACLLHVTSAAKTSSVGGQRQGRHPANLNVAARIAAPMRSALTLYYPTFHGFGIETD